MPFNRIKQLRFTLNGKQYSQAWIRREDSISGGKLITQVASWHTTPSQASLRIMLFKDQELARDSPWQPHAVNTLKCNGESRVK